MSQSNFNQSWAGRRLGLPPSGTNSIAKVGRRALALCVDWAISSLISYAFFKYDSMATLGVFVLEQVVLLGTAQASVGHRLFGLKLIKLDGSAVNILDAVKRTVLLALVIPATIWDADNRGLHDKAAKTALVLR